MLLRYGLLALGACVVALGLLNRSFAKVVVGLVVIVIAASLFQAHRVARQWHKEHYRRTKKE